MLVVVLAADIEVTLVGWRDRVRAVTARLRATWVPSRARHYRRPGGPWQVPTLDTLFSAARGGGEVVDGGDPARRRRQIEALVASVAGGLRTRGVRRGRRRGLAGAQQPGRRRAQPGLLAPGCGRRAGAALVRGRRRGEGAWPRSSRAWCSSWPPDALSDPVGARVERWAGRRWRPGSSGDRPSDVALVLFTSGSTGVPKAVLHTHRGLSWKASLMAQVHGLGAGDAVLMPAPMAHISGMLNGVLVPGAAGCAPCWSAASTPSRR